MTTKAHTRYRTKAGVIVPGVTTVLSLLAKPALIYWAWNLGMQGEDFRKVRDKAADIGTVAHYLVECDIKGLEPDLGDYTPRVVAKARTMHEAFLNWRKTFVFGVLESEIKLVSERYLYGGMLDCVARDASEHLFLLDIKTGKGTNVYDENKYQLAAYMQMWNETFPDKPLHKAAIIKLDKETGGFAFHPFSDLDNELRIFLHLRDVYALQKLTDNRRRKNAPYIRTVDRFNADKAKKDVKLWD